MLLSPCAGCDPHLAAAVVCYLSFFLSGCSFFLYWYWLVSYRDEQNPSGSRYADRDSDCENLDVDNPHVPENEIENEEPFHIESSVIISEDEGRIPSSSTFNCNNHNEDSSQGVGVGLDDGDVEEEASLSNRLISHGFNSEGSEDLYGDEDDGSTIQLFHSSSPCKSSANDKNLNQMPSSASRDGLTPTEAPTHQDDDDNMDVDNTGISRQLSDDKAEAHGATGNINSSEDGNLQEDDAEDNLPNKSDVSDNPYLNGDTYSQNMLWGLHGILTNLIEAILACVFYSGLFENNLLTSLVWLIGFGTNFIVGNFLYLLLLVYCTNKEKWRELRIRWALECTFNIVKDLYYLWVGAALLDHIVTV